MPLHAGHSKVRIWRSKGPGVILASIVAVLQIGHSGRKWNDILRAYIRREHYRLSVTARRRYRGGDRDSFERMKFHRWSILTSLQKN